MFYGGNPSDGNQNSFRPKPPDFSKFKEKGAKFFKRGAGLLLLGVLLVVLIANSVYIINDGEEGAILRFGQYVKTIQQSGLQFKLPFLDQVIKVNVAGIRRQEFGFRSTPGAAANVLNLSPQVSEDFVEAESLMLTGDQNLVNADWAILYKVRDTYNYLFRVDDAEATLRIISESTYRRVVASHPLDDVLTDKKDEIQREIMADLQAICDKYQIGILITGVQLQDAMPPDPVRPAFLDVSSAKEEKEATINESLKYKNEQLPVARGEAEQQLNEAEGYKQRRINEAEGSVARYKAIEKEYEILPEIMRTRLYMEMIREVLPKVSHVYFVDGTGNTVQFLPLNESTVIPLPQEGETP